MSWAAPAQAADEVIAEVPRAVPLAAQGSLLAFSRQDEDGGWRLVLWENGVARDAPVAPRDAPFDVDLGRARSGRVVAAYSRCAASCDLFSLDVAGGIERRLSVSRRGADETRPSAWGGSVVFAREGRLWRDGRRLGPLPDAWDLKGDRLATTHTRRPHGGLREVTLRVDGRVVLRSRSGELSRVALRRPQWVGSRVFTTLVRFGAAGQRFVLGRREVVAPVNILRAALVGRRAVYIQAEHEFAFRCGPCPIRITPPLDFS